ncbi:amidase [Pseudoroseicyclus aestuarii]|uniref:Asp-tRNA(Asn)/Glu-tRNA(Gln) amidotransferase A subunit family amidase n=1 Tax=Pseudoroseicyclus aestuarii TaxID=1795041 RepID=A0A318SYB8_9RHOB|nr:amidase [Pseudoroseicyclus aestuarii]PYE85346.1 Asp-tRNA(Asn)/Glu-tRNA(Gln) amidotransferase A subunit family amidase [Pseudoroseicyclus aestuarii]
MPQTATFDHDAPPVPGAAELLKALRAGHLPVQEHAEACLARIAARDGDIRAWSHVDPALVRSEAARLDRLPPEARGPLHGLAIGVKDVILTADMPTRYNSPGHSGLARGTDADCVAILRAQGALILGKCDTVEFAAMGRRAATRNPHDTGRTPGGSSSGSGAAVADGQVPVTLGTQTGGSVIRPAAFCGTAAMKPSWGAVSSEGMKRYSVSLDTLGFYGRAVADLRPLAQAYDLPGQGELPRRHLRLAVARTEAEALVQPEMRAAFDATLERLAEVADLTDLDWPEALQDLRETHDVVMRGEGLAGFRAEALRQGAALHPEFHARLLSRPYSLNELRMAQDRAALARIAFDALAGKVDAVVTYSALGAAPLGLASTGSADCNRIWTLLHAPVVNLPLPRPDGALPLGLSVTGARYTDLQVLAVAERIEAALAPGAQP